MNRKTRLSLVFVVLSLVGATQACSRPASLSGTSATDTPTAAPVETLPASTSVPPVSPSAEPAVPEFDFAKLGTTEYDVTYCTMDGVELKMDIYYPEAVTGSRPAVMYVHGGGWASGSKADGAGVKDILALQQAGFLTVAIDYRLAPKYKFPAMIEDVKCAVRFLRAHAEQLNIDPDRMGVYGGSAGGHLVNMLGVTDQSAGFDVGEYLEYSSRVQAVVDMFGPADLTVEFPGGYGRLGDTVFGGFDAALASPVTYVTSDDPPFLILHGDKDELVPFAQSESFYARLQAAGVPSELVVVKNAGHGFAPTGGAISPTRAQITQMVVEFFNQYLH